MNDTFKVGDRVCLAQIPPFLKTADPMPMLRPADILPVGAEGVIIDQRPGGYFGVLFERGSFLLDSQYLDTVATEETSSES